MSCIESNLEFHIVLKKKKASLSEMGSQIKKPLITNHKQNQRRRKEISKEVFMA